MAIQDLEKKVDMLQTHIAHLESQIKELQVLLDVEKIQKLQRIYGFYLEHWMVQEIIDCFAEGPEVMVDLYPLGLWKGKESIARYFGQRKEYDPAFLHQIMQLSPVIDVSPDGQTAKGRWYGYGPIADPGGIADELLHSGTYEMEYIKQDGVWKFQKLAWRVNYISTPQTGFVKFDRKAVFGKKFNAQSIKPDVTFKAESTSYPSGYIYPFHYNHPVTGKRTSEAEINATLAIKVEG